MQTTYKHTQFGRLNVLLLSLTAALIVVVAGAVDQTVIAFITVGLYLIILALFYALTIEVSAGRLTWWFGIGLIRKSHPLAEIESVTEVTSPWYYFWGIKTMPDGWVYSIGPGPTLEIVLKSGKKFRLGTNQPQALKNAIVAASAADSLLEAI